MQKTERERAWPQERGEKDSFGAKLRIRHSVDCRMAACDAELSQADRLWKRRYEDVGLLDTTAADDQPATVGFPRTSAWRPLVLLAFRVTEITSDIVSTHRIDRAGLSLGRRVDESICGTVTLLVPGDRSLAAAGHSTRPAAVGRVSRLAIDHDDGITGRTAASYRSVFLCLTATMHETALEWGLTHVDAIVHPRHAKLYRRIFGAVPIGEPFACVEVGGAPGQLLRMDISKPSGLHERVQHGYSFGPFVDQKRRV